MSVSDLSLRDVVIATGRQRISFDPEVSNVVGPTPTVIDVGAMGRTNQRILYTIIMSDKVIWSFSWDKKYGFDYKVNVR